ncbi:hypothetical protein FFI94_008945 [Rhodococcus sp. KBS0724]|uniref:hypothetical protein n=1 Tax=Rhodococcus sp. KBS0724 TaxID=1179674 RepID=UPI00110F4FDB|nr:hypothetical protein [Rhodococcus sp. KBS0724]TSD46276.1 hypothetical protein FFI94_008945 [Rhodococcus sp. KBS0724]
MITRSAGQHVFLALGTPWLDAAVAFLEPKAKVDPWSFHGDMAAGDILITVLDTDPRTVLCAETLTAAFSDDMSRMEVSDQFDTFHRLPLVPDIEKMLSIQFPRETGQIDNALGDRILRALHSTVGPACFEIDTTDPTSTAAHARTLIGSYGTCTACSAQLRLKKYTAGDSMHFHSASRVFRQFEPGDDCPAVLCRKCASRIALSGFTNLVEYMVSTHPPCPQCRAHWTSSCSPGMPAYLHNEIPWISVTGCVVGPDTPKWSCLACHHSWGQMFELPPERDERVW